MPGYIMHLCEGCAILDKLHISAERNPDFVRDFLLGCVLPDATYDKELTHFRPSWQSGLITKYPDASAVTQTFSASQKTAADCGILAHLLMDRSYVTKFWPRYFHFEDACGDETAATRDIDHVRMTARSMQQEGTLISFERFFSGEYFYGEYDITNPLFLRDFSPVIPKPYNCRVTFPGISQHIDVGKLARDLAVFAGCDTAERNITQQTTHIFPYSDMHDFITDSAEEYIQFYQHNLSCRLTQAWSSLYSSCHIL